MVRQKVASQRRSVNPLTGVDVATTQVLSMSELQLDALCEHNEEISAIVACTRLPEQSQNQLTQLLVQCLDRKFISKDKLVNCVLRAVVHRLAQPTVLNAVSSISQNNEQFSKYIEFDQVNCCFTNRVIQLTPELKRRWLLCVGAMPNTESEIKDMMEAMEYANPYDEYVTETGPYMFDNYQLFSLSNFYHWYSHALFEQTKDLAFNQQTFCANIFIGIDPYTRMLLSSKNKLFVNFCKEEPSYPSEKQEVGPVQQGDVCAMWVWLCSKKTHMIRDQGAETLLIENVLPASEAPSQLRDYRIMYDKLELNVKLDLPVTLVTLQNKARQAIENIYQKARVTRLAYMVELVSKETWAEAQTWLESQSIKVEEEEWQQYKELYKTQEGRTQLAANFLNSIENEKKQYHYE